MLLPGTRIVVRYKPVGYHCEINNKLKRWVFERIILWRIEGILFVATSDFELCIEHFEWWAEFWLLQNSRYWRCAHYLGRNLVHHFHKAFNVMELTELVSVGRTKAQEWCLSHGHKWRDVHAGVDFFGSPFSYRYLEPNDCCLYHIEWIIP